MVCPKFRNIKLLEEFYAGLKLRQKLNRILLKEISNRPINYILDVGIGFGNFAEKLLNKNLKVYGVEIDKERINYIFQKIKNPNLIVKKKDATKLDFKEKFDGVYCTSLYQIGKYLDVIKGVYKALRFGGWFFVDLYIKRIDNRNIIDFRTRREEFINMLPKSKRKIFQECLEKDISNFKFIRKKPEEWEKILQSLGFKIEKKILYYSGHLLVVARKNKKRLR